MNIDSILDEIQAEPLKALNVGVNTVDGNLHLRNLKRSLIIQKVKQDIQKDEIRFNQTLKEVCEHLLQDEKFTWFLINVLVKRSEIVDKDLVIDDKKAIKGIIESLTYAKLVEEILHWGK